jgi:hypothetical protein
MSGMYDYLLRFSYTLLQFTNITCDSGLQYHLTNLRLFPELSVFFGGHFKTATDFLAAISRLLSFLPSWITVISGLTSECNLLLISPAVATQWTLLL